MSPSTKSPLLFRITVLGEEGIGKDKFISSFTSNQFLKETDTGLGVAFYKGSIMLDTDKGQQDCTIWIWDLKEREGYKSLQSRYIKGTNGIMLFFDLTNRQSFNNLPGWIENFISKNDTQVPILLVGNRENSKKFVVSPKEISDIVREFNLYYIETSLTTKEGIYDSFYCMTSLTLGIDVDHDFFMSKEIIYYPKTKSSSESSPFPLLSPQDLSNLSKKAIFKRIESLDEVYEKFKQIKVPQNTLIIEIVLSIAVISLFIASHFLHVIDVPTFSIPLFELEILVGKQDLLAFLILLSVSMQIVVIFTIIINYFKGKKK